MADLAEFNRTVKARREALDTYRFDLAAQHPVRIHLEPVLRLVSLRPKPVVATAAKKRNAGTRHALITVLEALLAHRSFGISCRNHLAARER